MNSESDSDSDKDSDNGSTLRELLVRPTSGDENLAPAKPSKETNKKKLKLHSLDDVIRCVIDNSADEKDSKKEIKIELKHFIRK